MSTEASLAPLTDAVPADPQDRWAWILYRLNRRRITLGSIAERLGMVRQAASQVRWWPNAVLEQAIAEAAEVPVHLLWPDRYAADGTRTVVTRARRRRREAA